MTLALGIDIGTSGVRTAVTAGAELVSSARAPHGPQQRPDQIDATAWWDSVSTCLHAQCHALKQAGHSPQDVNALIVDGTSGSMVLTDRALNPVSPGLMYNSAGFDKEAAQIAPHLAGDHITKGANSALARALRLVSLAKDAPAHLLHQADFIAAKLRGQGGHSDVNNALKTGVDPQTGAWPDWISRVLDPALLPIAHAPGTALGPISAEMAATFGFSTRAQIHAGTTDSIAAFLACAPLRDGAAVTSLGSTLAVKLLSPQRIDDPAIGLYAHRLGDLWLVGGASNTGGAVLATYFDAQQLTTLSAQIDPGTPTGLAYYPLNKPGERFPINDPTLAPRLTPRPKSDARFLQAMFEGMARIEATCYREMQSRGATYPSTVFTAGGGGQNTVWRHIRAAALGAEIADPLQTEAAYGVTRLLHL